MKIIYIHQKNFHHRPPVISTTMLISELGEKLEIITTGMNPYFEEYFQNKGVPYKVFPFKYSTSTIGNTFYSEFWGRKVRKYIREQSKKDEVVLWIEGNHTITTLGYRFINKYPHVLQLQELFGIHLFKDKVQHYYMRKVSQTALAIMCPEYNRSYIYYVFFKLKTLPYVMPNKQIFFSGLSDAKFYEKKYSWLREKISGRKVILYQGTTSKERKLENFIKAFNQLDTSKYVFILMGKASPLVDEYKKHNPSLIHIDYIPAPEYLYVTSLAYIGVLSYLSYELNTVYCAPNKIFEYGMYKIPMIGNDIPGLRYLLDFYQMGKVCDLNFSDDILSAFRYIIENYDRLSINAHNYYESIDNKTIVEKVISDIKKNGNNKF